MRARAAPTGCPSPSAHPLLHRSSSAELVYLYVRYRSHAAAQAGYDSVQFTAHNDGGTNDKCCKAAGGGAASQPCHLEIVAVKLVGGYACCDQLQGAGLRAGWYGSRACNCVETANDGYVNCKGVPMKAVNPDPGRSAAMAAALSALPPNHTHADMVNALVRLSARGELSEVAESSLDG